MKKQKLNISNISLNTKIQKIQDNALKSVKGGYKGDPPPVD